MSSEIKRRNRSELNLGTEENAQVGTVAQSSSEKPEQRKFSFGTFVRLCAFSLFSFPREQESESLNYHNPRPLQRLPARLRQTFHDSESSAGKMHHNTHWKRFVFVMWTAFRFIGALIYLVGDVLTSLIHLPLMLMDALVNAVTGGRLTREVERYGQKNEDEFYTTLAVQASNRAGVDSVSEELQTLSPAMKQMAMAEILGSGWNRVRLVAKALWRFVSTPTQESTFLARFASLLRRIAVGILGALFIMPVVAIWQTIKTLFVDPITQFLIPTIAAAVAASVPMAILGVATAVHRRRLRELKPIIDACKDWLQSEMQYDEPVSYQLPQNGRMVEVTLSDRGPFHDDDIRTDHQSHSTQLLRSMPETIAALLSRAEENDEPEAIDYYYRLQGQMYVRRLTVRDVTKDAPPVDQTLPQHDGRVAGVDESDAFCSETSQTVQGGSQPVVEVPHHVALWVEADEDELGLHQLRQRRTFAGVGRAVIGAERLEQGTRANLRPQDASTYGDDSDAAELPTSANDGSSWTVLAQEPRQDSPRR